MRVLLSFPSRGRASENRARAKATGGERGRRTTPKRWRARGGVPRRTTSSPVELPGDPGTALRERKKDDDDGGTEDTDATRRALVGVLAAVALAAAPVADATEGVSRSISSTSSSSSSAVAAPWTRQLFDLAGFGAPTGALSSPPSPSSDRLRQILDLDERAASKAAVGRFVKTGNADLLLQELDALTRLDEKAITESADAEAKPPRRRG